MDPFAQMFLAALGGGSTVGTIMYYWNQRMVARNQHSRALKQDEIGILQEAIRDLRLDRDDLKSEVGKLRDDHSACKIENERLKLKFEIMETENQRMKREIEELASEVHKLRTG